MIKDRVRCRCFVEGPQEFNELIQTSISICNHDSQMWCDSQVMWIRMRSVACLSTNLVLDAPSTNHSLRVESKVSQSAQAKLKCEICDTHSWTQAGSTNIRIKGHLDHGQHSNPHPLPHPHHETYSKFDQTQTSTRIKTTPCTLHHWFPRIHKSAKMRPTHNLPYHHTQKPFPSHRDPKIDVPHFPP